MPTFSQDLGWIICHFHYHSNELREIELRERCQFRALCDKTPTKRLTQFLHHEPPPPR